MSNLPEGWIELEFDKICNIYTGNSISEKIKKEKYTNLKDGYNYIATKDVGFDNIINYSNGIKIPFDEPKFKMAPANTTLLCIEGGSAGKKIGFTQEKVCFGNKLCAFDSILSAENSKFIYYYLQSYAFKSEFMDNKNGLIGGVSLTKLKKLNVIIPPLNEQKRIVNKLDKLIAEVDTAQVRLEKIPQILKRFRQSVLMQAVTGELTKDWRKLNNRIFDWKETILSDVILEKPRNGYSPKAVNHETPVKSLTLTATTSGKFKPECFKYIDENIDQNSFLWLKKGDILIQRSNSIDYVGVSAIYDAPDNEYIYPDLMMKVKSKENILTEYLFYSLSNELTRSYFRQNATGTAGNMPKINQGTVMNVPILLPSLDEQKEIVKQAKALLEKADRIEERYKKAKSFTDKLTQSILNKAFKGELVAQDPSDEPASVLLDKIKTGKV